MRIATWNINGLRARLDFLRLWLEARRPDVVGLQELKITDAEFPAAAFEELSPASTAAGGKLLINEVQLLAVSLLRKKQVLFFLNVLLVMVAQNGLLNPAYSSWKHFLKF